MGWFDEQIRTRKQADRETFEDSFQAIAGAVMGRRMSQALNDDWQATTDAIGDILKYLAKSVRGKAYITEVGSDDPGAECAFVNVSHFPEGGETLLFNVDFEQPHTVDLHLAGETLTITLSAQELKRIG